MRVLCVCLGNICRSPMAEGAVRKLGAEAGLALEVDSAGTGGWHIGAPPHPQGLSTAAARGYDNAAQRARQVVEEDFLEFDLILAMDRSNLAHLRAMAPPDGTAEIRLFHPTDEIPDPYGEPQSAYDHALDMVEDAARALVAELSRR